MTADDLIAFCATCNIRQYLNVPWTRDGFTYASNGHVLIRCSAIDGVLECEKAPDVAKIFDDAPLARKWLPVPQTEIPYRKCRDCKGKGKDFKCYECSGAGEVSFETSWNEYEVPCESCDGSGTIQLCPNCGGRGKEVLLVPVQIGETHYQAYYLALLCKLPNCEISPSSEVNYAARIRFDGGDGLLMPVKP